MDKSLLCFPKKICDYFSNKKMERQIDHVVGSTGAEHVTCVATIVGNVPLQVLKVRSLENIRKIGQYFQSSMKLVVCQIL